MNRPKLMASAVTVRLATTVTDAVLGAPVVALVVSTVLVAEVTVGVIV